MSVWRQLISFGAMPDDMVRSELATAMRFRGAAAVRSEISDNLAHLTQKAGALLAAQAIFIVVVTWGTEHGWPRVMALISVLLLVVAALLVLTLLRSIYMPSPRIDDAEAYAFEDSLSVARVLASRGPRFNIALYMTFLSVILLGLGAIDAAMGWA